MSTLQSRKANRRRNKRRRIAKNRIKYLPKNKGTLTAYLHPSVIS